MTRKKKMNTNINGSRSRAARDPFIKKMREARNNDAVNQAVISNLESGGDVDNQDDIMNLRTSIIKEFSVIRKSDGLITGTNEVLRLLEKQKLIAVFLVKDKISNMIKEYFYKICREPGVPIILLGDKDKHIIDSEFPKSITYGIKDEPFSTLGNLKSLLKLLANRNKKAEDDIYVDKNSEPVSSTNISPNKFQLPSKEETTNQEVLDASTFYHSHEGHVSKKSNFGKIGYLSLNKFSVDESKTDFLEYDSFACSGTLSIK